MIFVINSFDQYLEPKNGQKSENSLVASKESCMTTVSQSTRIDKKENTFQGRKEKMAISYRRECYSKWIPQKIESSSSEDGEEEEEEAKTVIKSLSSIHSLMRQVTKVNTTRIQELRRRTRRKLEIKSESEEEFECSSSRSQTCSCIKVFISRKSSPDAKTATGEKISSDFGARARQQKPEVKETLDRAKKLLTLRTSQTMRKPNDEKQRRIFKKTLSANCWRITIQAINVTLNDNWINLKVNLLSIKDACSTHCTVCKLQDLLGTRINFDLDFIIQPKGFFSSVEGNFTT